jgi:hypothetical protein
VHGTAELKSDPGILNKTAELYAIKKIIKKKTNHPDAQKKEEELCAYLDSLVTAMNPSSTFRVNAAEDRFGYRPSPS